jgi:large subunit ribosomal protein L24
MKFSSPLSDELRARYKKRNLRPRVGDSVKIVRGGFSGIEGKVTRVDGEKGKVYVEGVTREKIAGGTAQASLDSSKVMLTHLTLDDKLRKRKLEGE